jgi:hypothetical protein
MLRGLWAAQELSVSVHDLHAPKENGALLAYPPLDEVGRLLEANRLGLGSFDREILDKPFRALRSLAREGMLDAAQRYLSAAGQPLSPAQADCLFLAGHQPELFHPGVWLKNFALCSLARASGGVSLNLVVDNDTAKNTLLHVPGGERLARLAFDHWQSEVPFEERAVVDEALFCALPRTAADIVGSWGFKPLLEEFWTEACRQGERTPLLGERFAAARRTFERRWGCANLEVPLSMVCQTEAFAWFACHLLENLPRFHEIYNAAVEAYRQRYGVRSRNHPVPNLAREGDWLEAPLWAWRAGQKRRERLLVRRSSEGFALRAGPETWPLLRVGARTTDAVPQWQALAAAGYKVRTRALTTTLYARLFLSDIFLHGLGGGKYDELTNAIMRRFYHLEPPSFLVLTGTLLLPLPPVAVTPDDRCRLQTLDRDLLWNPQRHLGGRNSVASTLAQEKNRWIAAAPVSAAEKRRRFEALRELTAGLRPFVQEEEEQTRLMLEQTARALRIREVQSRRDYAFCLYPEKMLQPFCTRLLSCGSKSNRPA